MVRSSLTPIALPAVPASALDSTTKSYCDGLDPATMVGVGTNFCFFQNWGGQSIPVTTETYVTYTDDNEIQSWATRGTLGAGSKITFGQTGIYAVVVNGRFAAGPSAGERFMSLRSDEPGSDDYLMSYGAWSNASVETTMTLTYVGKFTSGKYVASNAYQASSGAISLVSFWNWMYISQLRRYA